ncbi:MAG: glycosyltransferase [Elusimicrobia bacterium]|nr:glycosyltransferase [Candidatus Obscuribacterium magneticum]
MRDDKNKSGTLGQLDGAISIEKQKLIYEMDQAAEKRLYWKKRNRYYHTDIERFCAFHIPPGRNVVEIGCGTGDLLAAVKPASGVGIDLSQNLVRIAQGRYPHLNFFAEDAENLQIREKFDYVIMSDLIGYLFDCWSAFRSLRQLTRPDTRVVITYYNSLWEPILRMGQKLGLKTPQNRQNWLSLDDIENVLDLNGYEVIREGYRLLVPVYIPLLSYIVNRFIAPLPGIRKLCLLEYVIAREKGNVEAGKLNSYSCSVIIPCKNEAGNIEDIIRRTPHMGSHTEMIFVDGSSTDGTPQFIEKMMGKYKDQKDIKLIPQGSGKGKGHAVRLGFDAAQGDFLFILDADMTVPPEDLPKFYMALAEGQGEMINGTRLVYPMQHEAMRSLNLLANKIFSLIFTWLLDQRIKDTLCGTKVIAKRNYEKIARGRTFFGEFDPFGDFDLLFGAAKQNLKIIEIPVRYCARTYGQTKISRFRHGWLLLKMCGIALWKLKLA